MTDVDLSRDLCTFIERCPTMFHTTATIARHLDEQGFTNLKANEPWEVRPGGNYYVTSNGSSIISFRVGEQVSGDAYHFRMAAVHGDSPAFKVKHVPELEGPGEVLRLNVEGYGGMLDATWLDRPLGIAGRVMVQTDGGAIESRLVATDKDVAVIPNVAIHQRRDANKGFPYNRQVDLCPLFSAGDTARLREDACA